MKKLLVLLACMPLLYTARAFGAEFLSVKLLNKHLEANHATWRAKDNWLNHLSRTELVHMMGARGVHPSPVDFSTLNYTPANIPPSLDWRNHNGFDYEAPMLNQGECGSCVAFATIGTLESQINVTSGIPSLDLELSPQALFACGGGMCDYGWMPNLAAQFLVSNGVPDEACAPYTEGATGKDVDCSSICPNAAQRSIKISSYTNPYGMEQVKEALQNGPMVTTMVVYSDFITYSSGVYKHVTGPELGGHAVSLIGYNDAKGAWIIRNSWGRSWGMKGFAYVSYDDISGIGQNNTQFQLNKSPDYIYSPLRDRTFVSGVRTFSASDLEANPTMNNGALNLSIENASHAQNAHTSCHSRACNLTLNTTTLPDGKYTLVAGNSAAKIYRYFYVANQPENYKIVATPKFDATQPVHGRIVFNVAVDTTSSVPLQRISLFIQDPNGKVTHYGSPNVASEMTMGWRTPTVPNGTYILWLQGQSYSAGHKTFVDSQKFALNVQN